MPWKQAHRRQSVPSVLRIREEMGSWNNVKVFYEIETAIEQIVFNVKLLPCLTKSLLLFFRLYIREAHNRLVA